MTKSTRELMRKAGARPDPRSDQHFLIDDRVLDRIVEYATETAKPDSRVLEIGGGVGNLTARLAEEFAEVVVVELDSEFAEFLRSELGDTVEVVEGDAVETDLPDFDLSVSNLPYSVSSPVLFRLLPLGKPLVLTLQAEFAERAVAEPGTEDYGRLSVTSRHYAEPEILEKVPRTAFDPQPEVESAVARFIPREPDYEIGDEDFFMDFVRGVFTQRRKTLRNAIRNSTQITGLNSEKAVNSLPDDLLSKRPGKMSPVEFAEAAEKTREDREE